MRDRSVARWAGPAIALGALVLRLSSWRAVHSPAGALFVDVDDWHHLRRMLVAARNFPFLPTLDRYLAHPDGFLTSWPPLHDLLGGAAIRLAWTFSPGLETAAATAALLPAFFGAATVWLFHRLCRRVLPEPGAAAAALLAAVLPAPLFYTILGRPDHHCAEIFWFVLGVEALARLLDGGGRKTALAAAAALAAGWLSWAGFVAFQLVAFLWMLREVDGRGERATRAWPWVFAAQIPVLLLFTATNPFVSAGRLDFDLPSLFQPCAAAVMALMLEAVRRRRGPAMLAFAASSLLLGGLLLLQALPSLALFSGAPPRVFLLFSELQPLIKPYGRWTPSAAEPWFGWGLWLVPFLALDFARRRSGSAARLLGLWGLVFGALALAQTRYAMHFSFVFAALVGSALERAWAWGKSKGAALESFAAACFVAGLLLWPALRNAAALPSARAELTGDLALREACEWLRTNTPPTRSRDRDEGVPEYGVFADANLGPAVAALAERPTAGVNNHAMLGPLTWTIHQYLRSSPQVVHENFLEGGYRYLVLNSMNGGGLLRSYVGLLGYSPQDSALVYERSVLRRLYEGDGGAADLRGRFRQVHETPGGAYKVFAVLDLPKRR